jgi:hypothetical protein
MVAAAAAQSDSLGDLARSVRKDKKTNAGAKQFDNDNLPKNDKLSVVGAAPAPDASAGDATAATASDAAADASPAKSAAESGSKSADGQSSKPSDSDAKAEKQKLWDEWQTRLAAQKDKIDRASRELDVVQREYKLRAAAMYADAGNRLRNSAAWDKEDAQYKQQVAEKQKAVDAAKQQLEDMQEQARKAGVPSSKSE